MARSKKVHPDLALLPLLPHETIYIGVDVGKFRHVAGFLSRTLLRRHERFEGCPTLAFDQSREGFCAFVDRIREFVPIEQATVLLEHTGHYHKNLEQYQRHCICPSVPCSTSIDNCLLLHFLICTG
jgi:hypothetical protein